MLVALLIVPANLAATTITAPYHHTRRALSNPTSTAWCGSSAGLVSAGFSAKSGLGVFSDNASSKVCSSSTNNSGLAEGMIELTLPFSVKTNGSHTVTAYWITVAAGSLNFTAGTCTGTSSTYSGCTRLSEAYVYGYAYLVDKTTHKKIKPQAPWAGDFVYSWNYTSCYYTMCSSSASGKPTASFSGSVPWVWTWNRTFVNTHHYALKMYIYGGARVQLSTSNGATLPGASGNAQLNSATGGNDEQLYSVTVS